ncbi:uncharacterized protein SCHCODRAFT_02673118 [Schizophyllum commune H4-8]|nr:uncharacterized protein SCHCODRAFT_02673118 [Schizophyllum commune H4-8]KAI5886065.1 hypothetical protein SCHCODRAFT_02673118 [Schizophyllum commune H4-8]
MSRNTISYDSDNAKDSDTYLIKAKSPLMTPPPKSVDWSGGEHTLSTLSTLFPLARTCGSSANTYPRASLSEFIVEGFIFLDNRSPLTSGIFGATPTHKGRNALRHPAVHRNTDNVDMATTPASSNVTSAYDIVVKALEDKNAANAALAQAQSELKDLKETLARARKNEDVANEREYRLMGDLREMEKKVDDRESHILQVYALLDSIAVNWKEDREHVLKCAQCENAATVRFMDCGHTLCTRGCGEKVCANCHLDLPSASCDNHVWDHACPVIDCDTPATAVVPLTGSQAATALSGLRPFLNRVVDYVNDKAGEMTVMQEELDQRMDDD